MNSAACFGYDPIFTGNVETNSAWYVFSFSNPGTFTFVINPSNPDDDIDFVVYRLPNGVGNCNGKILQRCEASQCPPNWTTGLNTTANDVNEDGGCASGQDNFLRQLTVLAGETYALGINNFTSTGNGFNIAFGGTAGIQGPTAIINDSDPDDRICVGEAITYTDASTAPPLGTLVSWNWNFGVGATPATFVGQNPPSVTYSSTGTKTVTLTVKSDKGCLVTSTRSFTVNGVASSVSITSNQNNVCANTNITFTATPVNPGTTPQYQWYNNGVLIPGATNSTYSTTSINNNDKIKVVMTSNAVCATGSPATSNELTMTITPGTPVSVSIVADKNNFCFGTPVTFTATPSLTTLAPTYRWYNNGVLITGATGVTYTSSSLANNDVITVVMTSSVSCISGSPATSNAITMIVNAAPTVAVNSPSICIGSSATLTASGAATYVWSTGETTPGISVSPTSTRTYTVIGTAAGCNSASVTSTVTVNAIPVISVNSPTICNGQSATLTASGAATYVWSTGAIGNTISVSPTSTATYTVTGTTSSCPSLPKTSTVTVNAVPVVTVNSPVICSGNSTTLTASGATTYVWSNGATGASISVRPTTTTTYTVTGTTSNCPSLPVTSTVTVNATPVVTVNSPAICNGQSTTLTASGASTYVWSTGATGNSISVSPTSTTTYTVTGTTSSCPSLPKTATVTVNAIPVVTVNSPTICNGQSTTLTATGATTYVWSTGQTGASITVNPTTNTSYTVTGTTSGCPSLPKTATVTVNAVPVVTVNSPVICSGNSTTLTASGAATYVWSNGATGNSISVSPNVTTNYTVVGTTLNCPSLPKTATVTVNATPVIAVNSDTICNGTSATLTASGAATYVWNTGATGNTITVSPNITTNYTVVGTTSSCPSLPKTATVTVNSIPPVVIVNSPVICAGQSTTLTASGAATYLWNTGATSAAITVSPSSTTTYSVVGTTLACNSLQQNAVVTVNPKPVIAVTSDTICNGQTATLTASGATTYVWNTGATGSTINITPSVNTTYTVTGTTLSCPSTPKNTIVIVNQIPVVSVNSPTICNGKTAILTASGAASYLWSTGETTATIFVSPSSTTTYTVIGTRAGCPSLPQTSTVTVNSIPVVNVNSPVICSGNSTILTASGAATYVWSNGASGSSITVSPNATTTYTVTGTTLNCPSLPATSNVTVNATPVVSVSPTIICEGESTTLTASGATTYVWNTGATGASITVSPTITTTYTVTGTTLSCPSQPKSAVVTVSPLLTPTVSIIANRNDICLGTSVTFTATISGTGVTPTYQWFVNSLPVGTNSSQFTSSTLNNGDAVQVEITTTFRCSQPKIVRSNIVTMKVNTISITPLSPPYCTHDNSFIDLNVVTNNNNAYSIFWKNVNDTFTTTIDSIEVKNIISANVQFTIKYGNNCTRSGVVPLTVYQLPVINAVVDIPKAKYEDTVQLDVITNQNLSYNWLPVNKVNIDSIKDPISVITSSTTFIVFVQDNNTKCKNSDTVFVEMINDCTDEFIFVPTGFSPNNDRINDCFSILSPPKLSDFRMTIYNRWSETVFDTRSEKDCWNGTYKGADAAIDSYSYVISFRCHNGILLSKKGTISIIR